MRDGAPKLEGRRILDKRRFALEKADHIRKLLINEPRGHADMYGCFVTEPEDADGDLGVVFFHNEGYSTACGHGTIALVTWAIDAGVIPVSEPETRVVVDAPSGRLETFATIEEGRATRVRFRNVPSFVWDRGLKLDTSRGPLETDVSFGGAFYASVDLTNDELCVRPGDLTELIAFGREVKALIEGSHTVVHPSEPELRDVYGVIFFEDVDTSPFRQRNVTIFADGEVDRSPCGSGTSARLALLDASGRLPRGETLVHDGIVGTTFTGRVVGEAEVAGRPAVITEVEGSAYPMGEHTFLLTEDDPLPSGFLLR